MSILKCKICGGDLNIHEGSVICRCEYCGTAQTLPISGNEKKINLYNRANRLRMNAEFDKASAVYTSILAESPREAEAYWGLCLCKYGIEYVDDPLTAEKVPTCHRTLLTSILDDDDYLYAVEYADPAARSLYKTEARRIDELQQRILHIVKNEAPYDVFICYKETDDNGDRTEDSVIAHDIYDALTNRGLKVFFARITLEDKIGQEYEPYIYAALQSARVMLLVCTSFDNLDAAWVKNEWSRFLDLMKTDRSKILAPCYKGFEIEEMPRSLQRLQCQDLSKLGWIQDLTRGVVKICCKESQGFEHQSVSTIIEQKKTPVMVDRQIGHDSQKKASVPVLKPNKSVVIKEKKCVKATSKSNKPAITPELEKTNENKMSVGKVIATILHILCIMIVSICPHTFTPDNNAVITIEVLSALILPVFVWKADKKKSVKRILIYILLCVVLVLSLPSLENKTYSINGVLGIWFFIAINILC